MKNNRGNCLGCLNGRYGTVIALQLLALAAEDSRFNKFFFLPFALFPISIGLSAGSADPTESSAPDTN